ncbi:toll-like receptor 1 [Rhinatrema bivittatum]|uniref:toll-like receptor 1 n=1 Tax=Rhinatrema bivittatum TaxID=194408 RepID=UPI00112A6F5A|nr:toll-like receptor 1 [Rhinatrema bivittatum]
MRDNRYQPLTSSLSLYLLYTKKMGGPVIHIFILFCAVGFTFCSNPQLFAENELIANYSHRNLPSVPKSLPSLTAVLDLSYNEISVLLNSDFNSLSKLKVLNVSNNKISWLDTGVLKFNKDLEYLDLSNNSLWNISGTFTEGLRHLDLSFNSFKTLSVCKEFGNMLQLEFLGLSAEKIQKLDFKEVATLQLHTVILTITDRLDYEQGSLQMLKTEKLHIVFPMKEVDPQFVMYDAFKTSEILELTNIFYSWSYEDFWSSFSYVVNHNSSVHSLTLNNVGLPWTTLVVVVQAVWHSSIEYFTMSEVNLLPWITRVPFDYSNTLMKAFTIEHVHVKVFEFDQNVVYFLFSEMMIPSMTIKDANMVHMLCPTKPSLFTYLDFSNNELTDDIFEGCGTLVLLETLILQQNKLYKLSKASAMTAQMKSLRNLDISQNTLQYEDGEDCYWSESIITLNLSSADVDESVFKCIPVNVKTLDLHNNQISTVPVRIAKLKALEELNLASNRLIDLPDCSLFPSLAILYVDLNSIQTPSSDFLQNCKNVSAINAGNNPFQCDCNLRDFIYREKQSAEDIAGWPDSYRCEYPDDVKGTLLKDFHLAEISCNTVILLVVVFIVILVVVISVLSLCKVLDLPWYLKMMWQWTKTKHRINTVHRNPPEIHKNLVYHAFISYSQQDSIWVKSYLIPNLEKGDGSVQICQHERNFVPGRSIIENIINCIEKSYKSIFVLSPNFIQSEWCHYELYFAHHRLFTESSDNLILVLLEPIPQYLIPSKYYKLKALMAQRTYLEWPKEKRKHGLFWANLRAAINVSLSTPEETCSLNC